MAGGVLAHYDKYEATVELADGSRRTIPVRDPHFLHHEASHGPLDSLHFSLLEVEFFTTDGTNGSLDLIYYPGELRNLGRMAWNLGATGAHLFNTIAKLKVARKMWRADGEFRASNAIKFGESSLYHPTEWLQSGVKIITSVLGIERPIQELAREFALECANLTERGYYELRDGKPVGRPIITQAIHGRSLKPA